MGNEWMNLQLKYTGIEPSKAIEEYLEKKLIALQKYFDKDKTPLISVELGKTTSHHKSGNIFRAEIRVSKEGTEHYVFAEKEDLYAAIDEAKDEAVRNIVSSKKKSVTLLRRGGAKIKELIRKLKR